VDLNLRHVRWHRSSKLHLDIPFIEVLIRNSVKVRRIFTIQDIIYVNFGVGEKSSNKEELGETTFSFI